MEQFQAYRIYREGDRIVPRFEKLSLDDLSEGEVLIKARYSSINYKDALAATGAGRILRHFPLVGGIDVAGEVMSSTDSRYAKGDQVVVTGCGLGEFRDGGYAEYVRIDGDSVIPIPAGLDTYETMCLGTAGFTAALAVHKMEHNGLAPEKGPVVVTGASGGVGSLAIDMLSAAGYQLSAVTGKADQAEYLRSLGATEILFRDQIDYGERPLESERWAGAVDNVGGRTLTWLTRTTQFWGTIASIGLAESAELHTTVMPFILRGIALLGINSGATPREVRLEVWERLASDLKPPHLREIANRTIELADLPGVFDDYIEGHITGRTVVRIAGG